jgi:tetratricopeptide (TPR) repeat protein
MLCVLCVAVLYGSVPGAPFVYDDLDQILNNAALHTWHGMFVRFFLSPVAFTSEYLGRAGETTYRPLYWVTLELDRQLWGQTRAAGFHLSNLLLHAVNGVLLFHLYRKLKISWQTAALACLIWLALPINSEAVAWISGRAYLLSTLLVLLGLHCALSYSASQRLRSLSGYLLACLAALLSHEQGILLLPLTALLLCFQQSQSRKVWLHVTSAALLADLGGAGLKALVGAHAGRRSPALWAVGLEFWKYLAWMIAPVHMSVDRATSTPANAASPATLTAWVVLLAFLALALGLWRRAKVTWIGLLWGCVTLLPFCGFVYIYQGMAERFLYLPSIGFALTIASLAVFWRHLWKGASLALIAGWMMWGIWRLHARVDDWNDPVQLYQHSLEATPRSARLSYNLGYSLREQGQLDQAVSAYEQTLRLEPNYFQAHTSLGDIDAGRGEMASAIKHYDAALAIQPDDAKTLLNDGVALQKLNRGQEAEQRFKRVTALAPESSAAYVDLGGLYVAENRVLEAIRCFQRAIAIDPLDPDAYFNLAVLYQQAGHNDLALPLYRKVLELKPNDLDTLNNMSKLRSVPASE